jgi:hypothetical protein
MSVLLFELAAFPPTNLDPIIKIPVIIGPLVSCH